MFRTVPKVGLSAGLALQVMGNCGHAVSPEAKTVDSAFDDVVKCVEKSEALFGRKAEAISRLLALANESVTDSVVVDPLAVFMAQSFIRALPEGISLPEFSIEPDGAVSLDWIESRTRIFSLSANANGRFSFAWLDGTDRGYGVEGFNGQRIPQRIIGGITAITKSGNASLRIA